MILCYNYVPCKFETYLYQTIVCYLSEIQILFVLAKTGNPKLGLPFSKPLPSPDPKSIPEVSINNAYAIDIWVSLYKHTHTHTPMQ